MSYKLRDKLLKLSRKAKIAIASAVDFVCLILSIQLAFFFGNLNISSLPFLFQLWLICIPFISILVFYISGLYKSVLRYIDFFFIYNIFKAFFFSVALNSFLYLALLSNLEAFKAIHSDEYVSHIIWILGSASSLFLITSTRLVANFLLTSSRSEKKVGIFGAGSAGIQLAEALKVSKEMQPIVFFDSNPSLHNTYLGGIKILSPMKLRRFISRKKIEEVLIAMPSASKQTLQGLLKEIEEYSIKVRILPGLSELAQGKVSVSELKEVDVHDLLGRTEIEPNLDLINRNIQDKVVLVTGAGGSIGSEISRQVFLNKPKKLILLDSNEYALYSIRSELEKIGNPSNVDLYAVLGNITNRSRMDEILEVYGVQTLYHAAAYKHVSLVEENPFEAVENNIFGTLVCAHAALDSEVETFVLISTDKAVRPTNIMGATKRFSELILQSLSVESSTRMSMVRFGNVIGSSGSAIPLFQKQIKEGGPVTVTHPDVIRYFMSIPEAAQLVIQAGAMGKGGEVFVLDMGQPVKIYELAKRLINLSGMELIDDMNNEGDIKIEFTGLRPGEKLYEELLIGTNVNKTENERILRANEDFLDKDILDLHIEKLQQAKQKGDVVALREALKEVVSGYVPDDEIVDVIYKEKKSKSSPIT